MTEDLNNFLNLNLFKKLGMTILAKLRFKKTNKTKRELLDRQMSVQYQTVRNLDLVSVHNRSLDLVFILKMLKRKLRLLMKLFILFTIIDVEAPFTIVDVENISSPLEDAIAIMDKRRLEYSIVMNMTIDMIEK